MEYNLKMNIRQEEILEQKYQGVLTYTEAKQFLDKTPYTGPKIVGAIKRFKKSEGVKNPKTFIEMEPFVNDLADFWLDANPEAHTDGERVLHSSLSNFVAFSTVWKAKSKASSIVSPELMNMAGRMLIWKNTLMSSTKLVNSRLAHDKCPNRELYGDFKNVLPEAFMVMLPIVEGVHDGKLILPKGQKEEDLHRLIGCFFAGEPVVIDVVNSIKQIEYKKPGGK